jgi:hypothetical protein
MVKKRVDKTCLRIGDVEQRYLNINANDHINEEKMEFSSDEEEHAINEQIEEEVNM